MEDLRIFSFESLFFFGASLKKSEQGMSSSICVSMSLTNPKVIPRKFLGQLDLLQNQASGTYELTEVIVVCENDNLIFAAL